LSAEHRAQSTERRAQSGEPKAERLKQDFLTAYDKDPESDKEGQ